MGFSWRNSAPWSRLLYRRMLHLPSPLQEYRQVTGFLKIFLNKPQNSFQFLFEHFLFRSLKNCAFCTKSPYFSVSNKLDFLSWRWKHFLPRSNSPSDPRPSRYPGTTMILTHTPKSIGILWTNDQPETEISPWPHTKRKADKLTCPAARRDSNPQPQQASGCRSKP